MPAMHWAQRQSVNAAQNGTVPSKRKKRPRPKTGPVTGPKPNRKCGREQGRRICALPLNLGRGRRIRTKFGVAMRGSREEDSKRASATMPICYHSRWPAIRLAVCQLCNPCRWLKKNVAPLEGRAKPHKGQDRGLAGGNATNAGREEKRPSCWG